MASLDAIHAFFAPEIVYYRYVRVFGLAMVAYCIFLGLLFATNQVLLLSVLGSDGIGDQRGLRSNC